MNPPDFACAHCGKALRLKPQRPVHVYPREDEEPLRLCDRCDTRMNEEFERAVDAVMSAPRCGCGLASLLGPYRVHPPTCALFREVRR